jgi:predicted hydrocarbon binding protein
MGDKLLEGDFSWKMMGDLNQGREHLGQEMPVAVYRLFQYTMRAVLARTYGKDAMIEIFRESGRLAGKEFAENVLDLTLDEDAFAAQLQAMLRELRIGILRFEQFDAAGGHAVLTVSEDLDCSGLPVTGECVCNYDEGFLAGILAAYAKKPYFAVEVDCWARGDRVCRFEAERARSDEAVVGR